jgi:hypothetical protein
MGVFFFGCGGWIGCDGGRSWRIVLAVFLGLLFQCWSDWVLMLKSEDV